MARDGNPDLWKIEYSVRCGSGDAFEWVDDDQEEAEAIALKASLENPDDVYTVVAERIYHPDRETVSHFQNGAAVEQED